MTNQASLPTQIKALIKPSNMEFVNYMQAQHPDLTLSRLLNEALELYREEVEAIDND